MLGCMVRIVIKQMRLIKPPSLRVVMPLQSPLQRLLHFVSLRWLWIFAFLGQFLADVCTPEFPLAIRINILRHTTIMKYGQAV